MNVESYKDFIEIPVTEDILKEAQERDQIKRDIYGDIKTRRTNKSFHRMTGFIAEVAINRTFGKLKYSDDNHYDFIGNIKDRQITFDSKANSCQSIPQPHYEASIYDEGNFKSDVYIISRVLYNKEFNEYHKVWINGFISQKNFIKHRFLVKKGTKRFGYTCDDDRWEIRYTNLRKPRMLFDVLL